MVKLRGKLRSVLALAMAVILLVTMAMPTLAAGTASVGSVAGDINGGTIIGQDVDQGKQTEYKNDIYVGNTPIEETCDVYATVPNSGIVVTVPKVQILDGKAGVSNSGVYKVEVRGDISADTVITVSPLDEMADREGVNFEMSSAGKDNIPTDVEQERTAFTYADGVRPDSPATTTGVITAYGMTAGIWNGDFQFNIGASTRPLNTDELDERYEMLYYSALHKAVTDVNNNAVGENVDVPKDQAVAAVYTDENGGTNVVLLKDSTEEVTTSPAKDMTINLAGNTLKVNDAWGIEVTDGDVVIDGRTEGSSIEMSYSEATEGEIGCIYSHGDNLTVLGGTYAGNHSYSGSNNVGIKTGSNATIKNATITLENDLHGPAGIYVVDDSEVDVSDCVFTIATNATKNPFGIISEANGGTINVSNSDINVSSSSYPALAVYNTHSNLYFSKCNITVMGSSNADAYGIYNLKSSTNANKHLVVSDCEIYASGARGYGIHSADSIIKLSNTSSVACSTKQQSYGILTGPTSDLTMIDCYAKGISVGVQVQGNSYVRGGTYEGYSHGGFYFAGKTKTHYIENATLKQCDWFGDFSEPSNASTMQFNTACYIGGANQNYNKVYMNNCYLEGAVKAVNFRISDDEHDNTLYISNCNIKEGNKISMPAGYNLKLFIGKGNNFTVDNVTGDKASVTSTNEVYVK